MHVDDCADALVFMMKNFPAPGFANVGTGSDLTILELTEMIRDVVGFTGEIVRDETKPDGTPRKLLDTTRLKSLGWAPRIALKDGLDHVYRWYRDNVADQRVDEVRG
jgi:GDP-L-fucose synthase